MVQASPLLNKLQLIEQLSPEPLFRLKRESPSQFVSGRSRLSVGSQNHGQAEISLNQIRLEPDGFAKGGDRLRPVVDFRAKTEPEIEPGFAQVGLGLNGRA